LYFKAFLYIISISFLFLPEIPIFIGGKDVENGKIVFLGLLVLIAASLTLCSVPAFAFKTMTLSAPDDGKMTLKAGATPGDDNYKISYRRGGGARGGGVAIRGGGIAHRGGGVAIRGGGIAHRGGGYGFHRGGWGWGGYRHGWGGFHRPGWGYYGRGWSYPVYSWSYPSYGGYYYPWWLYTWNPYGWWI
jgi:hypothetical protein